MSHVLIVEDEAHLAKGLQFNLEAEGHAVDVVGDGEHALDLLLGENRADFDAVVLDVMRFWIFRKIHRSRFPTPVEYHEESRGSTRERDHTHDASCYYGLVTAVAVSMTRNGADRRGRGDTGSGGDCGRDGC